jgi:hypothetical protein
MDGNAEKNKPGAQPGHNGYFRRIPRITDRITVKSSNHTCHECSTVLVLKGTRKRIVEYMLQIP